MATFDDLMLALDAQAQVKRVNAERDKYYLSDRLNVSVRYGASWDINANTTERYWLDSEPEEIDISYQGRRASFMLPDREPQLGEQLQHIIDWLSDPTALPVGASRYEVL